MVIDGPVLAVGAVAIVIVVMAATWWPVVHHFRRSSHRASSAWRAGLGAVRSHLPAPAMAGVSMSVNGRGAGGLPTGTALGGIALAVGTALTAIGLTASLDALAGTPEQFGAPWDLSASTAIGNPDELRAVAELIGTSPDVEAAAAIIGTDVAIGDQVTWFQAFGPIDGVETTIGPVITAGRAPTSIDEIALGATTMADQGVSIGDTVELRTVNTNAAVTDLTVVGTTIINDGFEDNPGRGGVVTVEWIEENGEELVPDPFVVRLRPDADVQRMRADLAAVVSGGVYGPQLQSAIRNVERVSWVPFLLAALVGALAVASLTHALVLSVRRQRGQLAILKCLGFRRSQVRAAVAFHVTSLVVVAAVVGVPLGVILGRWGWRIVADEVGVASPPVTPLLWLAVIVVTVVAVANLVAAYPALGRSPNPPLTPCASSNTSRRFVSVWGSEKLTLCAARQPGGGGQHDTPEAPRPRRHQRRGADDRGDSRVSGVVAAGRMPRWSASSVHDVRPTAMPSGSATIAATAAVTAACHATAAITCRLVNPDRGEHGEGRAVRGALIRAGRGRGRRRRGRRASRRARAGRCAPVRG